KGLYVEKETGISLAILFNQLPFTNMKKLLSSSFIPNNQQFIKGEQMNYIARKRKMLTLVIFLMASTLLSPITASLALAQSSKGILTGTVTDPTGAVVAGANV